MLTVHHLRMSQSERVVWLCEELAIPYRLECYDRDPLTRAAPAEYKALHGLGAAPVITDGDITLAESNAIVDYIINRHGGGRLSVAPDSYAYPDYIYWLHFVNGTMQPAGMLPMLLNRAGLPQNGAFSGPMTARFARTVQLVEDRLSQTPFLAGNELTAADIMLVFTLTTMRYFAPFDLAPYPSIQAYLQTIAHRPAYRTAMAKGDPEMTLLLS